MTRRPNSLTVPSGVANCRNLPFGRRATRGSRVCLPWKGNARSLHQHLFEKTLEKPKVGLRTLSMKGSGVVFMHGEGISTSRIHHKGWQPLIECANHDFKIMYFSFLCFFMYFLAFLCFLLFVVNKGVSFAPTYPQLR